MYVQPANGYDHPTNTRDTTSNDATTAATCDNCMSKAIMVDGTYRQRRGIIDIHHHPDAILR